MIDAKTAGRLEGVIPALATAMREDGSVDLSLVETQAAYLGAESICGLFIGGTTGEGAYLSTAEKVAVFEAARRAVGREVALCLACIQPSTRQVLEEMRQMARLAPDFIVAVTPYYMAVSQEAVLEHFRAIAREAPAPLIVYNIPQNTHTPMALHTILELTGEKNIAGLKDSAGDFISFSRAVLSPLPGPFAWIQGEDLLEAPSYLLGVRGVVSGLSNVDIRPYIEMNRAARAGDAAGVREGQRRINALFRVIEAAGGKGIPAIKAAMEALGRGRRHMRLAPLTLSDREVEAVRGELAGLKLL
jgi:4-hydroxy-tetrahydrodipicolinate synthase